VRKSLDGHFLPRIFHAAAAAAAATATAHCGRLPFMSVNDALKANAA